jgi:RNA polymerase sigma-70 factor (family 1)
MTLTVEKDLLEEIARGNERAFSYLYVSYFQEIRGYVLKLVKSEEHSDDICQEIFLLIWRNKESLTEVSSFKAYIFTIARNRSFNFLKYAARERSVQHEISKKCLDLSNHIDEAFQTTEYIQYMEMMLTKMPLRSREVFELCRENGNSYKDAAAQLGISNHAVKKHMVRTMKHLKFSVLKEFGLAISG